MGLFMGIDASASGLTAERLRISPTPTQLVPNAAELIIGVTSSSSRETASQKVLSKR